MEGGGGIYRNSLADCDVDDKMIWRLVWQDASCNSLQLTSLKPGDRNLVLNLASLYSLSWTTEGDTTLTLSKVSPAPRVQLLIRQLTKQWEKLQNDFSPFLEGKNFFIGERSEGGGGVDVCFV
jgi:hypothetical protein